MADLELVETGTLKRSVHRDERERFAERETA
jgi:hypothetical protein